MLDKLIMNIAYKLPKRLVYWCFVRVVTYATVGKYSDQIVPDLTIKQAADRWEK